HRELEAPATFFIAGRTLEHSLDAFGRLLPHPFFDLQQHTYSHVLLKTVCMETGGKVQVYRGGSLDQIREEVGRTNRLFRDNLGIVCRGITGPFGYYRGLSDRPDVLEVLHDEGIGFTRTYGRNEKDYQPVSFGVQPFWYEPQGFPHMLEIPFQGWQDVYLRARYGWDNPQDYDDHLRRDCDTVAESGGTWSYCTHDWSSTKADPELGFIRDLVQYARCSGLTLMTHKAFYESELQKKAGSRAEAEGHMERESPD
ncbi:MAG: polysaccharide deacetylase family protein, partial [Firmicutes bacterium]|nr:polysaccharide deacetylase family protein [Bacillota bacterium]